MRRCLIVVVVNCGGVQTIAVIGAVVVVVLVSLVPYILEGIARVTFAMTPVGV
jgi:hypothetical protein